MRRTRFILLFLLVITLTNLSAQVALPWSNYSKKIVGSPSPLSTSPISMSKIGGVWVYSNYFPVGSDLYIKFGVQTNTNSQVMLELIRPFNILLPEGWNNTNYYITNKDASGTPINIARVTEGTTNNMFVMVEFNFEGTPDPPTGIIGVPSANSATIEWSSSIEPDVIGYNVYVSNKFLPQYTRLNTSIITSNSFSFTTLSNGTTNYFYVTSVDAYTNMPNNESPPSSVVSVVPGKDVYVLFYCVMDREKVNGSLSVAGEPSPLLWNGNSMEYLYNNIWYYKNRFTEFITIKYKYKYNTGVSNIYERDFDTSSKNREITLRDDDGDGVIIINDVWNVVSTENPAPDAPTNIIAIPGNSNVNLIWSPNEEIDIKGYNVYRSISDTNNFVLLGKTEQTNYIDTIVLNKTNYYYRLTAIDLANNESSYSPIVSATPSTNPAPIKPRGLKAISGNNIVTLNWLSNPESDVQGYVIYRSNSTSIFSNIAFTNTTIYTDTNVSNGITYYYKLRAVDTINQTNIGFSEMVSATPSTNAAPLAPTGLRLLLSGDGSLIIDWNKNPEQDISGYRVYYGTNTASFSNTVNTNSAILTGLSNGVQYKIYVKAIDSINQVSSFSEPLYAYPVPVIVDLTARPSGQETGAVLLSWTSPEIAGELGSASRYIVKYATNKINNLIDFQNAKTFCDTFANYSGMIESVRVNNLGTGCPGYYFAVGAVYGEDLSLGLSSSVYAVSSEVIPLGIGGIYQKIGDKMKVNISPDALPQNVTAIVIKNKDDIRKEGDVDRLKLIRTGFISAGSYSHIENISTNIVYDVYFINSASEKVDVKNKLNGEIKVYLPFDDANHNGIVDETEGDKNIPISTLRIFEMNEVNSEWGFIQNSVINNVDNLVYGSVEYLSLFTIMANLPSTDLSSVAVYPNPAYNPNSGRVIRFTHLTPNAKIRIYNLAGELVKQGLKADSQGICDWDSSNESTYPVASGIYIYYIDDGKNKPVTGKVAIIR